MNDDKFRDLVLEAVEFQFGLEKTAALSYGSLLMPFGKYEGQQMRDTPLSYLDRTISPMDDSWFVRRVKRFVDAAVVGLEEFDLYDLSGLASGLPKMSWTDLAEASRERLSQSVAEKQ
jgi:uncharacterized protein (DUF3820 family)